MSQISDFGPLCPNMKTLVNYIFFRS